MALLGLARHPQGRTRKQTRCQRKRPEWHDEHCDATRLGRDMRPEEVLRLADLPDDPRSFPDRIVLRDYRSGVCRRTTPAARRQFRKDESPAEDTKEPRPTPIKTTYRHIQKPAHDPHTDAHDSEGRQHESPQDASPPPHRHTSLSALSHLRLRIPPLFTRRTRPPALRAHARHQPGERIAARSTAAWPGAQPNDQRRHQAQTRQSRERPEGSKIYGKRSSTAVCPYVSTRPFPLPARRTSLLERKPIESGPNAFPPPQTSHLNRYSSPTYLHDNGCAANLCAC